MSSAENGGLAFPTSARTTLENLPGHPGAKHEVVTPGQDGMALRDFLAAHIAAGDNAVDKVWGATAAQTALDRARLYYVIADAMVIARAEQTGS